MLAITLTQPWATLVTIGAKRVETRSWGTSYRGQLAIHASKKFPAWARDACLEEPFRSVLRTASVEDAALPVGCVLSVAQLIGCYRIDLEMGEPRVTLAGCVDPQLTDQELAFGDYEPGRFAWLLGNVNPLRPPVPARGALGLWVWGGF